ncbi:proline-rich protein 36-like [Hippopotamus amphibius kiboko]|uniref:proline-rich protein 36-like n=1 Tax=Hippopotamus amphibius kiboko TaxID=575201 RepID=UPI002598A168|nr:proline-rich protein 36-like [Hippopotamus amphibius kiboko]
MEKNGRAGERGRVRARRRGLGGRGPGPLCEPVIGAWAPSGPGSRRPAPRYISAAGPPVSGGGSRAPPAKPGPVAPGRAARRALLGGRRAPGERPPGRRSLRPAAQRPGRMQRKALAARSCQRATGWRD